ncbi:MAG: MFS transporter [Myxococcota bacterium]|nr:MFS transporter [Myxococcota bacterium]
MVQLMNVLDFMMVMPLGDDFSKALGIAQSDVGYVAGAYTLAAFASGVIGARFLDRFCRKRVLLVAMLGLAAGTVLGGFAVGLWSMLASRVVAGLFGGPATATSLAIVADVVPVERRGRAMAVVMAGFSVASVIGLPLGLILARHGSWRTPFFVISGLVLVTLVLVWMWMPTLTGHLERTHRRTPALQLLARREIMFGLATTGCVMFSVFSIVPHFPTYLINNLDFPRDQYELLYLAGGIVSFAVLQIAGRWVDRHGSLPVITAGTIVAVTSIVTGFLFEPPFVPVVVAFTLFMASGSLRGVAQSTLSTRLPAPHERAQFMSLQSAVQHAAATLGAFATASIMVTDPVTQHVSPMWVVAIVAIVAAAAAPMCLAVSERFLRRRDAAIPLPDPASAAS